MKLISVRAGALLAVLLAGLPATSAIAAPACTPEGKPILQLRIVASEIITADRVLSIAVHDNDCVSLHLPDYYVRSGDHVVALKPQERAALEHLGRIQRQQPYSHSAMLEAAAELDARRAAGETELFAVVGADYVELSTRGVAEAEATTSRALGLFQYAQRYPQIGSLQAFAGIAQALLAISKREDLVAAGSNASQPEGVR